jgi:hypothetical protein
LKLYSRAKEIRTGIITPWHDLCLYKLRRRHRQLVAAKWDYSRCRKKMGHPPASAEVIELVLRMARENPGWGYDRIQGALANLGHLISNACVARMIFFGEKAMKNAVSEFLTHYHQERNHQGLNNQLLQPGIEVSHNAGDVACRERLGGGCCVITTGMLLDLPL